MPAGRPRQFKTVEELNRLVDLYFLTMRVREEGRDELFNDLSEEELQICSDIPGKKATVTGLALTLNLTRQGLINYEKRDEFVDAIKNAKTRIEMLLEERLSDSSPAGTIFNLKNNYNWQDKHEQTVDVTTGGKPLNNWSMTGVPSTQPKENEE